MTNAQARAHACTQTFIQVLLYLKRTDPRRTGNKENENNVRGGIPTRRIHVGRNQLHATSAVTGSGKSVKLMANLFCGDVNLRPDVNTKSRLNISALFTFLMKVVVVAMVVVIEVKT